MKQSLNKYRNYNSKHFFPKYVSCENAVCKKNYDATLEKIWVNMIRSWRLPHRNLRILHYSQRPFLSGYYPKNQEVLLQVNLCQKHLFSHQLIHNMITDCSLIYQFNTWKLQAQNMGRTCCAHKLFFVFVLTCTTIYVHNMFSPCSELVVFMYWTGKSKNNHLSYCGLVHPRISASDKDLPVLFSKNINQIWSEPPCVLN